MSFHIQTVQGDITKVDDLEAIVNVANKLCRRSAQFNRLDSLNKK